MVKLIIIDSSIRTWKVILKFGFNRLRTFIKAYALISIYDYIWFCIVSGYIWIV